jgi:hypothetical protein
VTHPPPCPDRSLGESKAKLMERKRKRRRREREREKHIKKMKKGERNNNKI